MTAKEYLRQLSRMDKRIDSLLERRDHYRAMASRGTARYTAERMGGTDRRSNVEDYVCKIVDLEAEIDRRIDEYVDTTREIEGMINTLWDSRFRDILTWRYINDWDWDRIARAMNFLNERSATNLHAAALSEFTQILRYYGIDGRFDDRL